MTLWAVTCSCGFECYRAGPANGRHCPKCKGKLASVQVPDGNRVMVQEANGKTSVYVDGQWVTVDADQ